MIELGAYYVSHSLHDKDLSMGCVSVLHQADLLREEVTKGCIPIIVTATAALETRTQAELQDVWQPDAAAAAIGQLPALRQLLLLLQSQACMHTQHKPAWTHRSLGKKST